MILPFKLVGNMAKGWISKRVFQGNKARQIFRKTNISYPLTRIRTCAYQGVRNVSFPEILACFVSMKHPFWDFPFCLISDELGMENYVKSSYIFLKFVIVSTVVVRNGWAMSLCPYFLLMAFAVALQAKLEPEIRFAKKSSMCIYT